MMKVDENGLKKERTPAKNYKYRIEWVEISPEMWSNWLKNKPGNRDFIKIGESIGYSAEHIRFQFANKPAKLNKVIWDAISAHFPAQ